MEVNSKEVYSESEDTYSILYQIPLDDIHRLWITNHDSEFISIDENGTDGESGREFKIFTTEDIAYAIENKHDIYIKKYYEKNK